MSQKPPSKPYLHELPTLEPDETFAFACHSKKSCFNACCRDLDLLLTPYDVLRLRQGLKLSSQELFSQHADIEIQGNNGFPIARLKMLGGEENLCPFVRTEGCSIYAHRPAACRTYPLGRGAGINAQGEVSEQFVIVKEPHCKGFSEQTEWTSSSWLQDQELPTYNELNDRYLLLMEEQAQTGKPLDTRQQNTVVMALYKTDIFCEMLRNAPGIEPPKEILSGEETALRFALQWISGFLKRRS